MGVDPEEGPLPEQPRADGDSSGNIYASHNRQQQQNVQDGSNDDTKPKGCMYMFVTRPLDAFLHKATFVWFFTGTKKWDDSMNAQQDFWKEFQDNFNEGDPDVFQVCAVLRNDPNKRSDWIVFKCIVCSFLQIVVSLCIIGATVADVLDRRYGDGNNNGSIEICEERSWREEIFNKIVASSLSLYVAMQFFTFMRTYNDSENAHMKLMYGEGKLIGLLGFFYSAGYFTNLMSTCIAAGGSFLLIYMAATPIDMILNCTALFFVMEMDDNLASADEIKTARNVLKDMDSSSLRLRDLHWSFNIFKVILGVVSLLVWACAVFAPFYLFVCYGSSWKGDL